MITRDDLIRIPSLKENKAIGCLCGLAIGDGLGDAARKQDNRVNYGITTDFGPGDSWSTDDTEFAMLTARTLIECGGNLTSEDVVAAWLKHVAIQDEFKRGGQSEIAAARNLLRGLRPPESGRFNTFHMSDGTAMRISPVGVLCAGDPERAAYLAQIDASISHSEDGIWGAQAVAAAVAVAMTDSDIDGILSAAMQFMPHDSWLYHNMTTALDIVEKSNNSVIDCWMELHDSILASTWATTAEAIPAAFACLKLRHGSFREGLVLAANFGRDADTIGAVAGAVLGARYGADSIPAHWIEKTRHPAGTCLQFTKGLDIVEIARQLSELIC